MSWALRQKLQAPIFISEEGASMTDLRSALTKIAIQLFDSPRISSMFHTIPLQAFIRVNCIQHKSLN